MKIKTPANKRKKCRRGVEAVEAAVTLPLLAFIMFASSHIAHNVHIQTCLKIAGSEAVYAWGKVDGTQEDAERVFLSHCEALGLKDCRLFVNRISNSGANNPNQIIRVSPRALANSNQLALPLAVKLPTAGSWIQCDDIVYRREANK